MNECIIYIYSWVPARDYQVEAYRSFLQINPLKRKIMAGVTLTESDKDNLKYAPYFYNMDDIKFSIQAFAADDGVYLVREDLR